MCCDVMGHTVLDCLIGRMLCYSEGRCRVFLGYVFSRVWRGTCQWLHNSHDENEINHTFLDALNA
jgi:hypothetical protein